MPYTAIGISLAILILPALGRSFLKAGKPGWAAIVPFYNIIVMLEVAERPVWWVLLVLFVPGVNVVVGIILMVDFANAYGKDGGFALGLYFLPFIFFPILGFGDATYVGIKRERVSRQRKVIPLR